MNAYLVETGCIPVKLRLLDSLSQAEDFAKSVTIEDAYGAADKLLDEVPWFWVAHAVWITPFKNGVPGDRMKVKVFPHEEELAWLKD